jgi:uncharacterized protein with HEPN domain
MTRRRDKRLREALETASLIHAMNQEQTLAGYLADEWFHAAVERKLEIIGEALNSVRRIDSEIVHQFPTIHEWPALGNVLSHGYFQVDHRLIWKTVTTEIPELIAILNHVLDEQDPNRDPN